MKFEGCIEMDLLKKILEVITALTGIGLILKVFYKKQSLHQNLHGNIFASNGGTSFGIFQGTYNNYVYIPEKEQIKHSGEAQRILQNMSPGCRLEFSPKKNDLSVYSACRGKRSIPYTDEVALNDALQELTECKCIKSTFNSQKIKCYKLTPAGQNALNMLNSETKT